MMGDALSCNLSSSHPAHSHSLYWMGYAS